MARKRHHRNLISQLSLPRCHDCSPQRLFDTDWHQLKVLVRSGRVTSYLDGVKVEEQLLSAVTPIYIDGKIQVAKKVKMEATVPVSFVSFSFFLIVFNVICTF